MNANDFPLIAHEIVRFRDIDLFGHVNNAVYLTYLETARIQFFRQLFEFDADRRLPVILGEVTCRYVSPAVYAEELVIGSGVETFGRKSFTIRAHIDTTDGRNLVISRSTIVMFDYSAEKTIIIPDSVKAKVAQLQGNWQPPLWPGGK